MAVDVVADRGGAMTGGRYSRPDLVAAVRRRLTSFDALEVHGCEVKPYWSADRVSVYEAVAQRALSLCTHAWVVLYLPDDTMVFSPDDRAVVAGALALGSPGFATKRPTWVSAWFYSDTSTTMGQRSLNTPPASPPTPDASTSSCVQPHRPSWLASTSSPRRPSPRIDAQYGEPRPPERGRGGTVALTDRVVA